MLILNCNGLVIDGTMSTKKMVSLLTAEFLDLVIRLDGQHTKEMTEFEDLHSICILEHDLTRALDIVARFKRYVSRTVKIYDMEYNLDTLSVILHWIFKYKPIYGRKGRQGAFEQFMVHCVSMQAKSVVEALIGDVETMFNYLYSMDLENMAYKYEKDIHRPNCQAELS